MCGGRVYIHNRDTVYEAIGGKINKIFTLPNGSVTYGALFAQNDTPYFCGEDAVYNVLTGEVEPRLVAKKSDYFQFCNKTLRRDYDKDRIIQVENFTETVVKQYEGRACFSYCGGGICIFGPGDYMIVNMLTN